MKDVVFFRLIVAAAAAVFVSTAAGGESETQFIREPARTMLIPWGPEEGSIGLLEGEEMESCGPLAFCVSGDDAQILDTVNARIVAASADKGARTTVNGVRATAIADDGEGGLLALEEKQIVRYSGGKRSKEVFKLPPKAKFIDGYGAGIAVSWCGVSAGSADQKAWTVATRSSGRLVPASGPAAVRASRGVPGNASENLTFEIKRMAGNEVRVLGADAGGKVLVAVPVQMHGDPPGAALFKGQDAAGNLYVEVERLKGGRAELEVHKYSQDGSLLALFQLPNDYYTTVYKKTEIAPDGTVCQLLTTPDGVKILRY
jgi:hypothetical protein